MHFGLLAEFDLLDQVREQCDDTEVMRKVIEEILRFGTSFPATVPRQVIKPTSFNTVALAPGNLIQAWLAAANRDNAANHQRWPNRHLGLGFGPHYCLGAELAPAGDPGPAAGGVAAPCPA